MHMMRAVLTLSFISVVSFADQTGNFKIEGMTCEGCVKMVKSKVCHLPGIEACDVKVGSVTLKSKSNLDVEAIKKAVDSTGVYKVVSEQISSK